MKLIIKSLFFLSASVVFWQCKSDLKINPQELGYDYIPLIKGDYRVYDVRSIVFKLDTQDTVYYQLKELVADTFIDLENELSFKIERYKRYQRSKVAITQVSDSTWQIDSIWQAKYTKNSVIVTESNQRIIKLSVPIVKNKNWNGNALNNKDEEQYSYQNVNFSQNIAGKSYSNCIKVMHGSSDTNNFIFSTLNYEIYSKNIGILVRENRNYAYCQRQVDNTCTDGKIVSGSFIKYSIIGYGKE